MYYLQFRRPHVSTIIAIFFWKYWVISCFVYIGVSKITKRTIVIYSLFSDRWRSYTCIYVFVHKRLLRKSTPVRMYFSYLVMRLCRRNQIRCKTDQISRVENEIINNLFSCSSYFFQFYVKNNRMAHVTCMWMCNFCSFCVVRHESASVRAPSVGKQRYVLSVLLKSQSNCYWLLLKPTSSWERRRGRQGLYLITGNSVDLSLDE